MDPLNERSENSVMGNGADGIPNDGTGVVKLDPWLAPFKESLKARYSNAQKWIKKIDETEGGLEKFSRVGPPRMIQFQPLTVSGLREVWHQYRQAEQYHL